MGEEVFNSNRTPENVNGVCIKKSGVREREREREKEYVFFFFCVCVCVDLTYINDRLQTPASESVGKERKAHNHPQ